MRYKPGQKEETRQKMTLAASHSFRRHGYAGVGVDGLAKAAGVTSGAFYTHFGSKEAAFDAALALGLDEVIEAVPAFQSDKGANWIDAFAEYYLGKAHREDLDGGCAMAALTPEVVRSDQSIHKMYEKKMVEIVERMSRGLAGGSGDERRARAWSVLSILIGGLNVARGMSSKKTTSAVSDAIIAAAIVAAGETIAVDIKT